MKSEQVLIVLHMLSFTSLVASRGASFSPEKIDLCLHSLTHSAHTPFPESRFAQPSIFLSLLPMRLWCAR